MMALVASLGLPLAKWALAKLGPYLKAKYKIVVAKIILWLRDRKEKNADHAIAKQIRESLEKIDVNDDKAVNDILDQLRNHF